MWSSNDPVARFASRYTKAIAAAFVAAAGAYLTLRAGGVTGAEWQTIGAAFLTTVLPTWAVPNTTPTASPFVACTATTALPATQRVLATAVTSSVGSSGAAVNA